MKLQCQCRWRGKPGGYGGRMGIRKKLLLYRGSQQGSVVLEQSS